MHKFMKFRNLQIETMNVNKSNLISFLYKKI